MNYLRLHELGREERSSEITKESPRQDTILEDTHQRNHRFDDLRNCIGKVSDYAEFDYHHAMRISSLDEIDLSSLKAVTYVPVVSSNVKDILPCENVVTPSTNVTTSPIRDNITAGNYAIVPIFRDLTSTKPSDISNVNRNMAADHIVATTCTVPSSANVNSNNTQRTVTSCSKEQLTDPQMETCTANMARNCQMRSVDVEDLALYFDWSSTTDSPKPSSSANRMIHTKRSRLGKRLDQTRQLRCERSSDVQSQCSMVNNNLATCNLRSNDLISSTLQADDLEVNELPSYNLESADVNCDNVAFHAIQSYDLRTDTLGIDNLESNDLQSIYKLKSNVSEICDPARCFDSRSYDGATSCINDLQNYNVNPREQVFDNGEKNYPRQCNQGQCNPGLNNGFCNNCPELFNFCTEERWLQCPASARCPLYDLSHTHNTGPILPPCMYENLQFGCNVNENWNHDYGENEQLLEYYVSNEKRKERSRDAARCRRSMETDIFAELGAVLPISPEQVAHLDKASVMRLAIAYLKMRAVVDSALVTKSESSGEMDQFFSKALNGFMLVLSNDGNMVYLSENVSDYLGISQMDMMGQSVYEYSHPCDHEELRECLSSKSTENNENRSCNFLLRLKCTLTSKGRKVNLKSASYKVIHCTGRLINIRDSNLNSKLAQIDQEEQDKKDNSSEREIDASLVLVGCPIPHPSNIEVPLGRHTFLSKHNLSMKFTYVDEKLAEYLGWNSGDLMDRSVFEFHHALDNLTLDKSFKCLFNKGQCETVAYRFLGKRGGYAWVVTQATLILCPKQQKPISVVCVNYIISGIEHEDEVYSERQLAAQDHVDSVKSEKLLPPLITVDSTPLIELKEIPVNTVKSTVAPDRYLKPKNDQHPKKLLTVATPNLRSAENDKKDGLQKDNVFPRPVQDEKVSVVTRVPEQFIEESIQGSPKENNELAEKRQNSRSSFVKAPFIFQGKPAIPFDSLDHPLRKNRPQAVTRHMFMPFTQQQQQQQEPEQQQQPQLQSQPQQQLSGRPSPHTTTASIFAPRTKDMNKGYLTFSEDQPGCTMLKDEVEDLTHLAPTAGDVCVPLEDTPFLSDVLEKFIFDNDNYGSLLSPNGVLPSDLRSPDLGDALKDTDLVDITRSKDATDSLAGSNPFIYGDSPGSPYDIDPTIMSPSFSKYQSPEQSVDSLGSPTGDSGGDGLSEDSMLMLGFSDSIGDDELNGRAPRIPMWDQDESLELGFSTNDMIMWSPSQFSDKESSKWLIDDREQRGSESSLAQLLRTDQAVSRRHNDHGGGLVNPSQILEQIPRKNTALESNKERIEHPRKRIHASTTYSENDDHKRLKCEELFFEQDTITVPEKICSMRSWKKSPILGTCGSQLLRRLVTETTTPYVYDGTLSSDEIGLDSCRDTSERIHLLNDIIDLTETNDDRDSGGSGGGGGHYSDDDSGGNLNKIDASRRNPSCNTGSKSVLMNLLVSGCDGTLIDSCNISLLSKSLISPLSVDTIMDSQLVPQSVDVSSLDNLNPDIGKHLMGPFTGGGGSIDVSPSISTFDSFDYDIGETNTAGLLQVGTDLLGTLLD